MLVLTAACAPRRPPPLPSVVLPGLERRLDVKSSTAPAAVGPPPSFSTSTATLPAWTAPEVSPATAPAGVPLVPTPEGRFAVVTAKFYFELPRGWKAPVPAPGGATLVDGDGRSAATVAFHPKGAPEYDEPEAVRRRLRAHGSVEDPLTLETVTLSGRYGTRRRWTTHRYKGKWFKLGESKEVLYSETILVPDADGVYLLSFRALKGEFAARRAGFAELLGSVKLPRVEDPWRPGPKERRAAVPATEP